MFDFNLGNVNLMPDVIGYIFFLMGFGQLMKRSSHFERGHKISMVLVLVSILEFMKYLAPAEDLSQSLVVVLLTVVTTMLYAGMVYDLCHGIQAIALEQNQVKLAELAISSWHIFLLSLAFFALTLIPSLASILFFFTFVILAIAYIMLIIMSHRASQLLVWF